MNGFSNEELEAALRDVLAHQAQSVDTDQVADAADDVEVVWLSDEPDPAWLGQPRWSRSRAFGAGAAIFAVAATFILFVAAVTPAGNPGDGGGRDRNAVLAALAATAGTGSFDVSYRIDEKAGATPPTSMCPQWQGHGGSLIIPEGPVNMPPTPSTSELVPCDVYQPLGHAITGTGSVQVDSLLIISKSNIEMVGHATVKANDHYVWETSGGGDLGQPDSQKQNSALSEFAKLAEGSLGTREAATVMLSLSSPTGYLTLTRQAAENASPVGHETVDGVEVSTYEVTLTPEQMAQVANASPEELKTITNALAAMKDEGFTGTTMRIGIGDDGLIHSVTSTAKYADGGTVAISATFSNFGCDMTGPTTSSPCAMRDPAGAGSPTTTTPDTTASPTTTPDTTPVISPPYVPTTLAGTPPQSLPTTTTTVSETSTSLGG